MIVSTGLLQSENITIASGGELRGYGTVDINSALGELTSNGVIRATNNGELVFTSLNNLAIALEGGTVDAIDGNIRFETAMITSMGADMTIGPGREVTFNDGGGIGAGGLIVLEGTPQPSYGQRRRSLSRAQRCDPRQRCWRHRKYAASGSIRDPGNGGRRSQLGDEAERHHLFSGRTNSRRRHRAQIGNAIVQQDTDIGIDTYDMDGIAGNTTITVNADRTLSITSPHIDTVSTNDFDGTLER